jgi:uncharacterized membrane protein YoaK (UPF0700 family)
MRCKERHQSFFGDLREDSPMAEEGADEKESPETRVAKALPAASLLALTGGALDAFVYLNHGHVFAAAMTGNGVLLGVCVLHRDWMQALRHTMPICGFVVGVLFARLLDTKWKRHAVRVGLLCEIGALLTASLVGGGFPDLVYVPLIAVVAAYQVESFRTADRYAYNSTFLTGNLRTAVDGLFDALRPETRAAGLRQFRALALIVTAFLAGATGGALLAPRWLNHTLWFVDMPLVMVLGMVWRTR